MNAHFIITTDNLHLRRGRLEDAHLLHREAVKVWRDLQNWMSWARDGNQEEHAMRAFLANAECCLLGFERDTGRFAISTGYHSHPKGGVETGYWVANELRGKGYATEATIAVLSHVFSQTTIDTVHIRHADGNSASARVIEKCGFLKTGVEAGGHIRCLDDARLDSHEYIMTRKAWHERQLGRQIC